ncbi:TonB-dependent receptor plug domain-containing protein [Confluentibacter citreus]|uniref:TonB-dependent receptor plug domain-containing protein n=1 Tax=Confluentibacter citreus TaxID=2007307 RepID=UPI000C290B56|nr:TonB-dependent receptor plug domain-containing protein [Confluentibacter citreus]
MRTLFKIVFILSSITVLSQEIPSKDAVDGTLANSTAEKITGNVTDGSGTPLFGVNVIVKGTKTGTQTDSKGQYSIKAKKGNVLVYSFIGMHTQEKTVENDTSVIDVILNENTEALKEVVINAEKISKNEKARSYSSSTITSDKLLKGGYTNVIQALQGTVAGLSYQGPDDKSGQFYIRGQSSFNHVEPLFIYDGVPTERSDIMNINIFDIEKIEVIKSASAALRYGPRAIGGVIVITSKLNDNSKEGKKNPFKANPKVSKLLDGLKAEESILDEPYIKELSKANSVEEAYNLYIKQKDDYAHLPAYFLNVYNYFKKWNNRDYKLRILFNDIITDLNKPEQLKALAYLLEEAKEYKLAINIYAQVLRLFPDDIQSYRDLALVYKNIGLEQESVTILNSLVSDENTVNEGVLEFSDIDDILLNDGVNISYDLRIVADWNRYDANINLQVIDPSREICNYENPKTKQGGQLAQNMSQGYGPEEFTLKNAKKGSYFIMVNYSLKDSEETTKPTYIKLTMFKDYGKSTETTETKVLQLTEPQNGLVIAKLDL